MKINLIFKDINIRGGAERLGIELARNHPNIQIHTLKRTKKIWNEQGVNIIYYRNFASFLLAIVYRKLFKNELFHLNLFPATYLAAVLGRSSIIHEHNTYNRRRDIKFLHPIERWIYSRCGAVICISEAVKRELSKHLCIAENLASDIVVIENFATNPVRSYVHTIDTGAPVKLGMIASFSDQKLHQLVLEAIKMLPGHVIHFAGTGDTLHAISQKVDEHMLKDRVYFHGDVANIDDFIDSVDLLLLLSKWEGFGLVVVEAARRKKLTIGSNVIGLNEVLPAELTVENDANKLAEKILEAENYNIADIDKITCSITKKYSKENFLKSYAKLINKLMN